MSVDDWQEKFSLSSEKKERMDTAHMIRRGGSLRRKAEVDRTVKKRKVILEDSSEEDDNDDDDDDGEFLYRCHCSVDFLLLH